MAVFFGGWQTLMIYWAYKRRSFIALVIGVIFPLLLMITQYNGAAIHTNRRLGLLDFYEFHLSVGWYFIRAALAGIVAVIIGFLKGPV
jgi:uncharacterized membrane protein